MATNLTKTPGTTTSVLPLPPAGARLATIAGAAVALIGTFLAWTWTKAFPGNLTVTGYPGGLQIVTLTGAALTLLFALSGYRIRGLGWLTPGGTNSPVLLLALGTLGTTGYTMGAISNDLGGIVNLEPGAWISGIGALIAVIGALGLPADVPNFADDTNASWQKAFRERVKVSLKAPSPKAAKPLNSWLEILILIVAFAVGLQLFAYGIGAEPELFIGFLVLTVFGVTGVFRAGLIEQLNQLAARHRGVALAAAFAAAAAFPFIQNDDYYARIGVDILVFATVALGLNVVVGLAGLLDLGYVAFLGVGAYAAALVSGSPNSSINGVHFPFWAAVLTGAGASLIFGVLIGAPTLRLRGDYLAIVTLGFGEIFRVTVNNLNGRTGPNVTNGSNGIPNVPDLEIFGFNLGLPHDILGITLGRNANYFLLMLFFTAIVVLVFRRSGESRIGRAWVAIREDETAATAMGINGFRVKLIAFALGATLAGLAGTVQAHVQSNITPEQYLFSNSVPPNSAFLLAAVILGGMGTVSGPLVGAALLYLIPAKLEFLEDFQLMFFGLALILLMRFRPEGIVANKRAQLEFHETGQTDVPEERLTDTTVGVSKAGA
ncbi:branched-chain amino acid ABC transporter permease [Streptomyces sp. NBC_01304]|uniref:branched-chain amino acid ABC transporter permease n=1 Tax=Streptomyces sp. NBC_01304 TaxID=2903818 RepID=UPI002E15C9C7|nr:branched-chain amino acid ABC transporter permease [Streptomyces sp. NBC_01304]